MPNLPKSRRPAYLPTIDRERTPTSDQRFYHSDEWQRVRWNQILRVPYCEVHQAAGVLVDCTQYAPIDHIVPISAGGAPLDERNLMTMCKSCHDRKSGFERHEKCLVATDGQEGEKIPAEGSKTALIERLKRIL